MQINLNLPINGEDVDLRYDTAALKLYAWTAVGVVHKGHDQFWVDVTNLIELESVRIELEAAIDRQVG